MKKSAVVVALAALGFITTEAMAQQSPWLVRARAVHIDPADKSSADPLPANAVTVSNKTIPELDISYFITPNIAAELILTYPQKHNVYLKGTGKIGTFKHLPPTLSLQYHFTPDAKISPYVGAGINYTRTSSEKLVNNMKVENDSFGYALQAGVDFKLDKNWSINLDVKKVQLRADVTAAGAKVTELKIDPLLIGVGIGYRF